MTSAETLYKLLQENNGYLKTAYAVAASVSGTVSRNFVCRYDLGRVVHGL